MQLRFKLQFLYVFITSVFIISCSPDNENPVPSGRYESGLFIINEGNFSDSDGSVSFFNSDSSKVYNNIFAAENNVDINGLVQSMRLYNNNAYIVTNAMDKIEVVEANTFNSVSSISPADTSEFQNPIDFAGIGNKGFVTNWGPVSAAFGPNPQSFLTVLDLNTNTVMDTIQLHDRPQQLMAVGDKLYVTANSSNMIFVVDPNENVVSDSIQVELAPYSFAVDANNKVWVMCVGDYMNPGAHLVRINPASDEVEAAISLTNQSATGKMAMNGAGNQIYYATSIGYNPSTDAIFSINIDATTAPSDPLITGNNLYGVGVDPTSGMVYVADNNAFQGNGTVITYDADGVEQENFQVGRGPSGFVFK